MKLEVGKRYSCRDPNYFGEVYYKYYENTRFPFAVKFYKQSDRKVIARDTVTEDGRRYTDTEDFLDLMTPMDKVCLGELK